jgi:hypothetical protein
MTQFNAQLLQTDKGAFVNFESLTVSLWIKLPEAIVQEISDMVTQEQQVLERLRVEKPELHRMVYFKKLGATPLKVVLRSTEEVTMLSFVLECQTACANKSWELEPISGFQRYHIRAHTYA